MTSRKNIGRRLVYVGYRKWSVEGSPSGARKESVVPLSDARTEFWFKWPLPQRTAVLKPVARAWVVFPSCSGFYCSQNFNKLSQIHKSTLFSTLKALGRQNIPGSVVWAHKPERESVFWLVGRAMRPVCVDQAALAIWGNTSHISLWRDGPVINLLMASICTKCLASQPLSELVPHTLEGAVK